LLAYFAALGIGFMLVEMPLIQRLTPCFCAKTPGFYSLNAKVARF
jgi:hypothetical protein